MELAEGGSLVSGFQREVAQNKEGAKGILTTGFTGLRRQREGLAVVAFYSEWQHPVGAINNVSPSALKVKTGSRHAGEASCASGQAQEATVLCDGDKGASYGGGGGKLPWGARKVLYIGRGAPNSFGGLSLSRSGV
jgi:hypothetical protein